MEIPRTLEVIIQCWDKAEAVLRRAIKQKHHDPEEEFITRLFCDEFSFALQKASRQGRIAQEFLMDLRRAYPELSYHSELKLIADNLIASVSLHKRHIEKFTGGDFGLTITRPDVSFSPPSDYGYSETGYIEITSDYQRGLLCQAKLRQKSSWGRLTPKQKRVIPERLAYLALLLYECGGDERQLLRRFAWQLCAGAGVENISEWLRSGTFPTLSNSSEIVRKLGAGGIGTDDKELLEQIIRPTGKPQFSIRIYWGSDRRPPPSVPVTLHSSLTHHIEQTQEVHVHVARG